MMLEYSAPVNKKTSMNLLQRDGGGLSLREASHGLLYGMCSRSLPRPVVNLLNVAAKVKQDVPQGVRAERCRKTGWNCANLCS